MLEDAAHSQDLHVQMDLNDEINLKKGIKTFNIHTLVKRPALKDFALKIGQRPRFLFPENHK